MMRKTLLILGSTCALLVSGASGQLPPEADPGRSVQTREDLERLLAVYDETVQSPAYSESVKESARVAAERIRARLRDGDFRLGDRITLYVEGEPELPDTVAVQAGPMISLPLFGDISLEGVLRSELEGHLTEELRRFIREPVVRAQGLMRVSILGAVGRPGFYVVPADMVLGEALMAAGGPAGEADLENLRIERGPNRLFGGEELQEAVREGRTLDQLNLQAGDQIVVPERGGGFISGIGVVAGLVSTVSFILWRVSR